MEYRSIYLDTLRAGDMALHFQLFPSAYPPDVAAHESLMRDDPIPEAYASGMERYKDWVRSICVRGVTLARLRTLPAQFSDDVEPMIAMCQTVAEAGEQVKVTIFERQVDRLTNTGVLEPFAEELQARVPRAGLWSIRYGKPYAAPAPVGVMNYRADGSYPGIEVHRNPSVSLAAYEAFWWQAYYDNDQSVPLEDWQKLYG
jgi:hypothetical protein